MSKLLVWVLLLTLSFGGKASTIGVKPIDCGPLARGEYGVVFYVLNSNGRTTYFTKGGASDVCPKLLSGKLISGYEAELPRSKLFTDNEKKFIKEFIVISYGK